MIPTHADVLMFPCVWTAAYCMIIGFAHKGRGEYWEMAWV